jgi:stage II sporulation protein D
MKDYVRLLAVFTLMLVLIPTVGFLKKHTADTSESADTVVKILSEESGEITEYSLRDYIIGAVFAQMPADFEDEALKAQAVLASTYAKRRMLSESESPTESLNGADMSDNTDKYQAFFTAEQAKAVYSDSYDDAYKKISSAAEYAENLTLTYNGTPIIAAFHGISFGSTESALSMWGEDIPYLQSVESDGDENSEQAVSEVSFDEVRLKSLLSEKYPDSDLDGSAEEWISIVEKTEKGTVLKLNIGGTTADSDEFCELLGLSSQHFEFSVDTAKEKFTFTVSGCGHLVGMSQYGANEMAKQGKSCEEILLHYFKGTVLETSS